MIPNLVIPDLGPQAAFIWLSYAMTAAVLAGLIAWLVYDGKRQARLLAACETRKRTT